MKNILFITIMSFLVFIVFQSRAISHCEIPCGIYNDELRIILMEEHTDTIEKSIKKVRELSTMNPVNHNQVVRWILNKEEHAKEIQYIVTQYFMTQRIKPDQEGYREKLSTLHRILITAMAMSLLIVSYAGAAGAPEGAAEEEKMTITWMARFKDSAGELHLEEKFNINIEANEIWAFHDSEKE